MKARLIITVQHDFDVDMTMYPQGFTLNDVLGATAEMIMNNYDVFFDLVEDGSVDITDVSGHIIDSENQR